METLPSDSLAALTISNNNSKDNMEQQQQQKSQLTSSSSATSSSLSPSPASEILYPYPNYPSMETRVHLLNIFKDSSCPSASGSTSFGDNRNISNNSNTENIPGPAAGNLSPNSASQCQSQNQRIQTPTALDVSEKLSSELLLSLIDKYRLDSQAFANMLVCYPNIKEEIVARYLGFFPGKKGKNDISKACEQLDNAILYRSANSIINYSTVEQTTKQNFFRYHGTSKGNACVAYFSLDNHNPKNRPPTETYIKSIVYAIEKEAQRSGKNELMETCLIIDRRNATMKNQDLELIKAMFHYLTFLYPNATPLVLVCPCNMATRVFFNILKPFLDKNIADSTKLVKDVKEIQEYVEKSEIKEDMQL